MKHNQPKTFATILLHLLAGRMPGAIETTHTLINTSTDNELAGCLTIDFKDSSPIDLNSTAAYLASLPTDTHTLPTITHTLPHPKLCKIKCLFNWLSRAVEYRLNSSTGHLFVELIYCCSPGFPATCLSLDLIPASNDLTVLHHLREAAAAAAAAAILSPLVRTAISDVR